MNSIDKRKYSGSTVDVLVFPLTHEPKIVAVGSNASVKFLIKRRCAVWEKRTLQPVFERIHKRCQQRLRPVDRSVGAGPGATGFKTEPPLATAGRVSEIGKVIVVVRINVLPHANADLPEVGRTQRSLPASFSPMQRRQQHRRKDSNDRHDHEQFYQCETFVHNRSKKNAEPRKVRHSASNHIDSSQKSLTRRLQYIRVI